MTRFGCSADDVGEKEALRDLERQLGRNVDVRRGTARLRNSQALGFEAVEMKRNRALHLPLDFFARAPGRDATRQVRRVCGEAGLRLLNDDQILHGFNPACLRMLFNVPGATSSPGLPATVTSPGFVACLNCRCDPRCRTTDQPSSLQLLHDVADLHIDIIVPRRVRNTITRRRHQSRRLAARVVTNLVTPSRKRCKSFEN